MRKKRSTPYLRSSDGSFARRMNLWTPANWDNGQINHKGYFVVYRPDYPRAWKNGYAPRYHVVWWLSTGTVPCEDIHHKDHNKLNDRLENLETKSHAQHTADHFALPPILRRCRGCNIEFVFYRRDNDPNRGRFCSQKCYHLTPRTKSHRRSISEGLKRAYKEERR